MGRTKDDASPHMVSLLDRILFRPRPVGLLATLIDSGLLRPRPVGLLATLIDSGPPGSIPAPGGNRQRDGGVDLALEVLGGRPFPLLTPFVAGAAGDLPFLRLAGS